MRIRYVGKLLADLIGLARANRAYWLLPLVVVLLLGALVMAAGQGAAPFVYTLF